jgi:hypothetical protein
LNPSPILLPFRDPIFRSSAGKGTANTVIDKKRAGQYGLPFPTLHGGSII